MASLVPFRGDREQLRLELSAVSLCGVDRRCHYSRGRGDLCAHESAALQSQICDWVASAGWWRCASSAAIESIEVACTKRDAEPPSDQKSYTHTRTHTDAAVSRRIRCYLRRRGCCQQQLGIGARCSSQRRACWSARTASEIFRDIQIRQPERSVNTVRKSIRVWTIERVDGVTIERVASRHRRIAFDRHAIDASAQVASLDELHHRPRGRDASRAD